MNFYHISSTVSNSDSYATRKRYYSGINDLIVYNTGYYKEEVTFITQDGYTLENIKETDFIKTIPKMPLFSERFVEKLHEDLKGEMDFFPAKLSIGDTEIRVYLGKINIAVPLINMEKSNIYEVGDDEKVVIPPAVLLKNIAGFQFCAKDIVDNPTRVFSEAFKELVVAHKLNIKFTEYVCA